MWGLIWKWLKRLVGLGLDESVGGEMEAFGRRYADDGAVNLTAVVAHKLANVAVSECAVRVRAAGADGGSERSGQDGAGLRGGSARSEVGLRGGSARAAVLDGALRSVVSRLKTVAARALGVGGVVLKPWVSDDGLKVEILDQDRVVVLERDGDCLKRVAFIADVVDFEGAEMVRVELHQRDGARYVIEQHALKKGREVPLGSYPGWAGLPVRQELHGVKGMLFGWVRCPVDNRRDLASPYGVPVTYGCEALMGEIDEQLAVFQSEIVDKRTFVGADYRLFSRDENGRERLLPNSSLFKKFDAAGGIDDKPFFEVYSPDMRVSELAEAVNFRLALLEKAIGVNRGVLTDLASSDATATAIKRANFDTFALVDALRAALAVGLAELVDAMGALADACRLAPAGDVELLCEWSYGLIEDSHETFEQLARGVELGAVSVEELRDWVMDNG